MKARMIIEMRITQITILLLAINVAFAQKTSVAVLPSESTDASLTNAEENILTHKIREVALNVLPPETFTLLNQDAVVKRLGGAENYIKECKESSCIVDLGKKAQVDYVAKASVSKLGSKLMLNVELYNVSTSGLVGVFNGDADNIYSLIYLIEQNVPDAVFRKIPGASKKAEKYDEIYKPNFEQPSNPSKKDYGFWLGLTLDFVGAGLLAYGVVKDREVADLHSDYRALPMDSPPSKFAERWEKADSAKNTRNALYIVGGLVLAAGIGVHIWF